MLTELNENYKNRTVSVKNRQIKYFLLSAWMNTLRQKKGASIHAKEEIFIEL